MSIPWPPPWYSLPKERTYFPVGIKHDDRVLSLAGRFRLLVPRPVLDVDQALLVNSHSVRLDPVDRTGKLAPVVVALVAVFSLADDRVFSPALSLA